MSGAAPVAAAFKVFGAKMEADEKVDALESEASAQEENAINARIEGQYRAHKLEMQAGQMFGEMEVDRAASGISQDSVSFLDVLKQSHVNAEMDRQNIIHGSDMRARGAESRAYAARKGAKKARDMGNLGIAAALFDTGASAYAKYGDTGGNDAED